MQGGLCVNRYYCDMKKYNVLVIGSGGREHAIALKLSTSTLLDRLFVMPGNPGTASFAENLPGNVLDFGNIAGIIRDKSVDIVVVGPEDPLVHGLRDYLEAAGILENVLFVGPGKSGARLEGSKDFAKGFMRRHGIPTAAYRTFSMEDREDAIAFMKTLDAPYVLKADGLAAGKGVLILDSIGEAVSALDEIFAGKFGHAGDKVVIEQYLKGIEVSFFAITDGHGYVLLPEAKDYKRAMDGDAGLNTGGMGAVSPVPFVTPDFRKKVEDRIIRPTIKGLEEEGTDYRGFIFFGLMDCAGDPYVIEYNVRMGDPETEAVMSRVGSDLLAHLVAAARGDVSAEEVSVLPCTALTGIVVSGGYPQAYGKGYAIDGIEACASKAAVFHSGTAFKDGRIVTAGGRVLAVTVTSGTLAAARELLYSALPDIKFENSYYRSDIGADMLKLSDK